HRRLLVHPAIASAIRRSAVAAANGTRLLGGDGSGRRRNACALCRLVLGGAAHGDQALKSAVVLLSGGLDSMVCGALARDQGYQVVALTIDYNQRHRVELEAARRIADRLADRHIVLPLDLRAFGGSALTSDAAVPKDGVQPGVPITYVPARNLIFLSLALAWGEAEGAKDLFI